MNKKEFVVGKKIDGGKLPRSGFVHLASIWDKSHINDILHIVLGQITMESHYTGIRQI